MVRGLARQLYLEVADSMSDMLLKHEGYSAGKLSQKSLRIIRAQSKKMNDLTFLHDSIAGSVQLIEDVLASMPKSGYIEGRDFAILKRLVSVMADADDMLSAGAKRLSGEAAADVLFPPVAAVAKASAFVALTKNQPNGPQHLPRQAVAVPQSSLITAHRASGSVAAGFKPQKLF
jgi:hypothetical protein